MRSTSNAFAPAFGRTIASGCPRGAGVVDMRAAYVAFVQYDFPRSP
jgi:hypothetical protein